MDEEINASGVPTEVPHSNLMEIFDELSWRDKLHRTIKGLGSPKDSGDYKFAKLQILRLWAPFSAIAVPMIAVIFLAVFSKMSSGTDRAVVVEVFDANKLEEKLDDIKELEPPPEKDPVENDLPEDPNLPQDRPPAPQEPFSPKPRELDTVAIVKSPVTMRGIYQSRDPGARGSLLSGGGGGSRTEDAVLRALRWLKKNQQPDGSWVKNKHAMTGLALLCYLAHGETPASEEFGPTVLKAMKWLVANQNADGGFPRKYEHAIATYALCEAYGMTKVPMLKGAAEKAVAILVKGQNASGGFDYELNSTQRDDTSVMGWAAQALKAGKVAGLEVEGLDAALKLAVKGFRKNAAPAGGFGYVGPGATGLTGVGVLCMQLLGAAREGECVRGLQVLANATYNWDQQGAGKFNQNYYWYYITQAKFHAGGPTWSAWNAVFSPTLVKNQKIQKAAILGPGGKMVDIGWWEMDEKLSGHTGGNGTVMNTALCCLQLEVYYRFLPTYKAPVDDAAAQPAFEDKDKDVNVDIK